MTNRGRLAVAAATVAIGGTAAIGAAARSGPGAGPRPDRWHAVTVNLAPQDVGSPGRWPQPIADLGDRVEVRVVPAPGDRGTELAVRARAGLRPGEAPDADDLQDRIRVALRHSRMLLETGEVLQPDRPSTTRPTVTSLPLRAALRRSQGGGRL
ncbi:hypothetical protein [Cellulomonas aerilata]|uniref:hypothetical protein n=1 Tax=Cellulomonas aerilata TaxID=515326 RepID=UPI001C98FF7E|nr:hypothetical protein [Cellulomonas aerilata]